MEDRVKLYYQCNDKLPLWDFCGHAAWGARWSDVPAIPFEYIDTIPDSPYNIIVGSVEESSRWLQRNGFAVPTEIAVTSDIPRMWTHTDNLNDEMFIYPCFIKPKDVIKAFPGTVVKNPIDAGYATEGYVGDIWASPIFDFLSEWRCYIHRGKIIGVCHYGNGDPAIFPDRSKILMEVEKYNAVIDYNSYTLDFGIVDWKMAIFDNGELIVTKLIEGNDAWAISNYGLDSVAYFEFIKDRWLQLTGLKPSWKT